MNIREGILLLSLVALFSCSKQSDALASFDGGDINADEFFRRYENYLSRTGLEDNLPDRKKILRSAVHEELILLDWEIRNLDDDPGVQNVLHRQETQAILNAWWQFKSKTDAAPSPKALAAMLINEKTRYHIKELRFENFDQIKDGSQPEPDDWHDLGYISLEDIHPRLVARIRHMQSGDISEPIRSGSGYRLIQMVDKQIPPLISPQEFAAARDRLTREWVVNHQDSIMNAYTDELLKNLHIRFEPAGLDLLMQIFDELSGRRILNPTEKMPDVNTLVCRSVNSEWTLSALLPHIQDTQPRQLASIIDQEDIKKLVSGILVRQELLESARQAGIDKQESTLLAIQRRQDLWRIKEWQDRFADTVHIDEAYLAELDAESSGDDPGKQREIQILVFGSLSEAEKAYESMEQGQAIEELKDLDRLASPDMDQSGYLGWVSAGNLGAAGAIIFDQDVKTWTKPWTYGSNTYLFRSLAEQTISLTREERLRQLEQQVRISGAPVQLEKALAAMEQEYHVTMFTDRIKEIPYIQISGQTNES